MAKPIILDGAIGTQLLNRGSGTLFPLPVVDLLNLEEPLLLSNIHREYLEAGADIIKTNTFMSNRDVLAKYNLSHLAPKIALTGAKLAAKEALVYNQKNEALALFDKENYSPKMVAGVIGPGRSIEGYYEQVLALLKGGADLILLETQYNLDSILAALEAIEQLKRERKTTLQNLKVMLSVTLLKEELAVDEPFTICGVEPSLFLESIAKYKIWSIGANCSFGPHSIEPMVRFFADNARKYLGDSLLISAHPNWQADTLDSENLAVLHEFIREGLLDIVGGCCGTTPASISALYHLLD